MNIAYFVYNFDYYSGAAFQAKKIASYINETHKIFIFSINQTNKIDCYNLQKNVVVINLYGNILKQLLNIFKIVRDNNIKIFHLHGFITRGLVIGKLLNQKIILKTTLMGTDDFDSIIKNSNGIKKIVKKYLFKKVDVNATLTKKMKEINSKYIDEKKIKVIPNGVIIPDLNVDMTKKENEFAVVGMICPRKRTYESIKYYIDNYSKLKNSKLYVVGPTESELPEFDKEYLKRCKNLIKENKDKDIIITGKLTHKELEKIYLKCKSIILFSKKEGMPNVVLEAMAYNAVPIMTRMDGVSIEILGNNEYGFVLNDINEKININYIDKLIKEKVSFKRVSDKYNIKNISSRYEELYNEINTK